MLEIADGGTFNCLATTWVVWDIGALKALAQPTVGATHCDNTGRTAWTYTPTAQGGNTGVNIIVRNGTDNWYVNNTGELRLAILDGGTYLCLANHAPIIWNTPDDKINTWTPVGTYPRHVWEQRVRSLAVWGIDAFRPRRCRKTRTRARVAAGGHSLALKQDGTVVAWGQPLRAGQCPGGVERGDRDRRRRGPQSGVEAGRHRRRLGRQQRSGRPQCPVGLSGVTAIAAGGYHSLALKQDGTVVAWGCNGYGQTGNVPAVGAA